MLGPLLYYLILLGVWLLIVYQVGEFAKQKGYDVRWAIILGIIFNVLAFIVYWSLPDNTKAKK